MKIELTPEQDDVVRHAVETGRVHDVEQAAREAIDLWVERERHRAELLESLDAAEASLARGEGTPITKDSMKSLTSEVMARARARIDADTPSRR